MVDCSEKVRALRESRRMTQQQVADHLGVSKSMISAYETALKTPAIDKLVSLSALYGVSVDYLVCVDSREFLEISGLDDDSVALLAALAEKLRHREA